MGFFGPSFFTFLVINVHFCNTKKGEIIMPKLTKNRVARLRCSSCGSRQKRIVHLQNSLHEVIGFSTVCCECGSIKNYAIRQYDEDLASLISSTNMFIKYISCGTTENFCPHEHCKYYKKKPMKKMHKPEKKPKSVYKPKYEQPHVSDIHMIEPHTGKKYL